MMQLARLCLDVKGGKGLRRRGKTSKGRRKLAQGVERGKSWSDKGMFQQLGL
jgi:hypothetical protein